MRLPFHLGFLFALLLAAIVPAWAEGEVHARVSKFAKLEGCEFLDTAVADGDSFRMRVGSEEHVFRL